MEAYVRWLFKRYARLEEVKVQSYTTNKAAIRLAKFFRPENQVRTEQAIASTFTRASIQDCTERVIRTAGDHKKSKKQKESKSGLLYRGIAAGAALLFIYLCYQAWRHLPPLARRKGQEKGKKRQQEVRR